MPSYKVHAKDGSADGIRAALEAAGWETFTTLPVDLLCHKNGVWKLVEAKVANRKDGSYRPRKDQEKQNALVERLKIPRACSAEAALAALEG